MSGLLFNHTPHRVPVLSIHNREEALLSMRHSRRADLQHRLDHKKDWQAGMELGHYQRLGIDGVRDPGQAEKTYGKVLGLIFWDDDNTNASVALTKGFCHHNGWGCRSEHNKAKPFFQKARRLLSDEVRKGDAAAAFDLAGLFYSGLGGDKDPGQAVHYYALSARQSHILAMTILADILLHGPAPVRDSQRGADTLEALAAIDDPVNRRFISDAQFRLGVLYYEGRGRPASYVEAYVWFTIAAANDNGDAGSRRRALESHLTPAQIQSAQARTQQWRRGQSLPPPQPPTYPSPPY